MQALTVRGRTATVGLGSAALLSALVACGCRPAPATTGAGSSPRAKQLTIITPHNAKIREAFAVGFSDWRETQGKTPVNIAWIQRGTPQCVDYVNGLFTGTAEGRDLMAPDLMFGGGIADHLLLGEKGYTIKLGLNGVDAVPAEIHGQPTRGASNEWRATGLSSFGFVYNQHDCELRGIQPPATWADLADPRFQGWIGVASPAASGSHRQALVFILESADWVQGWSTVLRILANSRAMLDSSSTALDQVDRGVFLAAFAVNFDGLARADASEGRVLYVNPPGATAVTPDVTSVLKTAKDVELATDFVRYCLSEPGQVVWGVRAEDSGRSVSTLYHYPIDPAVYVKYSGQLAVKENPYEADFGLKVDAQRCQQLASALLPLVRAATGENHILLQQAWAAVIAAGMNAAALQALTEPPLTKDEALALAEQYASADAAQQDALVAEWAGKFRQRYLRVLELAGK